MNTKRYPKFRDWRIGLGMEVYPQKVQFGGTCSGAPSQEELARIVEENIKRVEALGFTEPKYKLLPAPVSAS